MPRYYFDLIEDGKSYRDEFGADFEDFAEARMQALVLLPDVARHDLPGQEHRDFVCEVRNAADRVVYRAILTVRGAVVDESSRQQERAVNGPDRRFLRA